MATGFTSTCTPNGARYWRLKYRHGGKERLLAVGIYPNVGLKEARVRRDEARRLIAQGIDPTAERKRAHTADTFRAVAERWLAEHAPQRKTGTVDKYRFFLDHMHPHLGLPVPPSRNLQSSDRANVTMHCSISACEQPTRAAAGPSLP